MVESYGDGGYEESMGVDDWTDEYFSGTIRKGGRTGITFSHSIAGFTPDNILHTIGITPANSGPKYYTYLDQLVAVIGTEVLLASQTLNEMIKLAYASDMSLIPEYSRFPRYIAVMERALSRPEHVGIHWSKGGRPQADFINTSLLGDLGDLQRIQRTVNPPGSLLGWIGIYRGWLSGRGEKYEEVVNTRLDIMESEGIAPFWQLIEDGNGPYAYPVNGPMRTLLNFRSVYQTEMRAAYSRCLAAARALTSVAPTTYQEFAVDFVVFKSRTYYGFTWVSQSGKNVFTISGTSGIDKMGKQIGRGFVLDDTGEVLREWHGWLPR